MNDSSEARRASVESEAVVTEYLRVGDGAPVVYLGGDPGVGIERQRMVQALAQRFRVFVPQSVSLLAVGRADGSPFASWLVGVLEGLGIGRARLVAEPSLAAAARVFADTHAGRVERLVLMGDDGDEGVPPAPEATMLVVGPEGDSAARAVAFLLGERGAPCDAARAR